MDISIRNLPVYLFCLMACALLAKASYAQEVMSEGSVDLPISTREEIYVFQFSTQQTHLVKRSEYDTSDSFKAAFEKQGDIYVEEPADSPSGSILRHVRCFKSQFAFYPMLASQFEHFRGGDFSALTHCDSPLSARQGALFGLDTQAAKHALIKVSELKEKSVVLDWIYRQDGKGPIFVQLPRHESSQGMKFSAVSFQEAERYLELRDAYIKDLLSWWKDVATSSYEKLRATAAASDPFSNEAKIISMMTESSILEDLRKARTWIAIPALLDRYEKSILSDNGDEIEAISTLLKELGRPTSLAINRRLRETNRKSIKVESSLKKLLSEIEGVRVEGVAKNQFSETIPEKSQSSNGKLVHYRFFSIPRSKADPSASDIAKVFIVSLSKGCLLEPINLGVWSKVKRKTTLSEEIAVKITKMGGDMGVLGNNGFLPSKRYKEFSGLSLQNFNGISLAPFVEDHDSAGANFANMESIVVETIDKKYGILQLISRDQESAYFVAVFQPDGSDQMRFEPLPSPIEVWDKYSGSNPVVYRGYVGLAFKEREAFVKQSFKIPRFLQQVVDGTILGVDVKQRSEAIHLLGRLNCWEAAEPVIRLAVEDKINNEGGFAAKLDALKSMLPYAANKVQEMIQKEKDPKRKTVLQEILKYLEEGF